MIWLLFLYLRIMKRKNFAVEPPNIHFRFITNFEGGKKAYLVKVSFKSKMKCLDVLNTQEHGDPSVPWLFFTKLRDNKIHSSYQFKGKKNWSVMEELSQKFYR